MASSNQQAQQGGIGVLGMLLVLFVGLKLTGYIGWSWWWVVAPVWGPIALIFVFAVVAMIFAVITALIGSVRKR